MVAGSVAIAACGDSDTRVAVPGPAAPPVSSLAPDDGATFEQAPNTDDDVPTTTRIDQPPDTNPALVPGSTTTAPETSTTAPPGASTSTTTLPDRPNVTTAPVPIDTLPVFAPPIQTPADPQFSATAAAFDQLARNNATASVTVTRGGVPVYANAAGTTVDGAAATADSPMVVASVSKLMVAVGIARLHTAGVVDIAGPVPWTDLGLAPDPAWNDVTVRELLDHRGGMSKARTTWFTGEGTCRNYIPYLLVGAPQSHRGEWVYSNGNYCLLGLLIEQRTGLALDAALQQLVFDPVEATGAHLTLDGLRPEDAPYGPGVARLSRLGGAGTLVVSTNDLAAVVGRLTPEDRAVLQPPSIFFDQYGIGHTGTVDGAKSCVWILDGGATVVAATIAGNSLGSGGAVCDLMVPAIATDLGINQGEPDRWP